MKQKAKVLSREDRKFAKEHDALELSALRAPIGQRKKRAALVSQSMKNKLMQEMGK